MSQWGAAVASSKAQAVHGVVRTQLPLHPLYLDDYLYSFSGEVTQQRAKESGNEEQQETRSEYTR